MTFFGIFKGALTGFTGSFFTRGFLSDLTVNVGAFLVRGAMRMFWLELDATGSFPVAGGSYWEGTE